MFKQTSFKKIAAILNKILATDPYVLKQFSSLQGKTLRIILSKTPFDFLVRFHEVGINIESASADEEATVQLTGTPTALLRFAKTKEQTQMLMDQKIQIKGDLDLLMQVKKIEQQLSIDWEGLLAEYFGDFAANRLCLFLKQVKEKCIEHGKLLQVDTLDYLYDELQCLPRAEEVQDFYESIRDFRRDIERFEARLKRRLN